jgi:tetratricopeptide (TPR) repeat protein
VDLGLLVHPVVALGREARWARRLTMGLSVRNAIAPTIRLDEEDVADPATVRLGTAYRTPLFSGVTALAALDLEKPRDSGTDLRLGVEIAPHPLLALRTGFNGDDLTAGVGIRWRLYRFDYAFEDNVLESVHRFGVSLGFGATVRESRRAARDAEDEAFRAQLEDTFERRRAERIDALLGEAGRLLAEDRADEAMPLVATVQALDPEEPRARKLQADVLAHHAAATEADDGFAEAAVLWGRVLALRPDDAVAADGLERCRAESNRRAERSVRIRELFAAALDAFSSGDLLAARARLDDILALAPDDVEAQAMRERTLVAIDAQVGSLLATAGAAIDRGQFASAAEILAQARALDPEADGLSRLGTRLARAENDARRRTEKAPNLAEAPAVTQPALSKKKRREIADLYRRGMEAMEEDRTDDALKYWELVWLADPDYQDVAEFLKREYLLRGLESFSHGGLDEAIRLWEKARDVDPEDEKTLGYLSRAREQLSRTREILGE